MHKFNVLLGNDTPITVEGEFKDVTNYLAANHPKAEICFVSNIPGRSSQPAGVVNVTRYSANEDQNGVEGILPIPVMDFESPAVTRKFSDLIEVAPEEQPLSVPRLF